jgi:lysine biosynthesis protein LysW
MQHGYCPECDSELKFHNELEVGERLNCQVCRAYLIVVGVHPVELDWVYLDDQIKVGDEEV